MDKNRELEYITNILNHNSINYWIDSGTLLGIYREGKVLEHDFDIDISMWNTEEKRIVELITILSPHYHLRVLSYCGYNFKYKFTPLSNNRKLTIDINLFVQKGNYAYCPQPVQRKNIISQNIWRFYHKQYKRTSKANFDSLFLKILFKMYTWKAFAKYFSNTIKKGNYLIPNETEKYLQLRYGNWKIPKKEWSFEDLDKGLSKVDIKKLYQTDCH